MIHNKQLFDSCISNSPVGDTKRGCEKEFWLLESFTVDKPRMTVPPSDRVIRAGFGQEIIGIFVL